MPQRLRRLNPDASPLARFGARLREYRIGQGLAQAELGRAVHVSGTLIAKMERAERRPQPDVAANLDRRLGAHGELAQLAAEALTCPVTPAGGIGVPAQEVDSRLGRCLEELRLLADVYDLPEDGPVRPLPVIERAVEDVVRRRLDSDYRRLANVLPGLITELTRATLDGSESERELAAGWLTQAWRAADAIANKLGRLDLSARLIHVMEWAAAQSGNGLAQAATAYVRTETFFASGQHTAGHTMLERAADRLEQRGAVTGSADSAAQFGALHMRAAIAAARASLPDRAQEHLEVAQEMARVVVREDIWQGTAFGPDSVRVHRVHTAVELNLPQRALLAAGTWAPPDTLPKERRSHYFVDKARAELATGAREEARRSLELARRIAPENVAVDVIARATQADLDGERQPFAGPSFNGVRAVPTVPA